MQCLVLSYGNNKYNTMKKANLKATLKRYDDNRYFHRNDFDWIAKRNIQLIDETFKSKKK